MSSPGRRRQLGAKLLTIYRLLFDHYGTQGWWPADGPFEVMVGAVLTQSAAWTNVEKAIANLKTANAMSPRAIRGLPDERLAELVRPSGYYNVKARKLKALAHFFNEAYGDDIAAMRAEDGEVLREKLLRVYGIGEETADDIALYAADIPTFVIDAYTKRLFARLGLAPQEAPYAAHRAMFMDNLPAESGLYNEYHALIVRHAKDICRKTRPLCERCVLVDLCPTGKSVARGGTE